MRGGGLGGGNAEIGAHVALVRHRDRGAGEPGEFGGTTGQRQVGADVADIAVGGADLLAGVKAQGEREGFREHGGGEQFGFRGGVDGAEAGKGLAVLMRGAAEIVGDGGAEADVAEVEQIEADALAGGGEEPVLVADVDRRAALALVAGDAVGDRRILPGGAKLDLPGGDGGLEQAFQLDAGGVLPFRQRRGGLRGGGAQSGEQDGGDGCCEPGGTQGRGKEGERKSAHGQDPVRGCRQ